MVRGWEKFLPALAWLFCLALPGSCLARFAYLLAGLCRDSKGEGTIRRWHRSSTTVGPWPRGNLRAGAVTFFKCSRRTSLSPKWGRSSVTGDGNVPRLRSSNHVCSAVHNIRLRWDYIALAIPKNREPRLKLQAPQNPNPPFFFSTKVFTPFNRWVAAFNFNLSICSWIRILINPAGHLSINETHISGCVQVHAVITQPFIETS